MKGMEDELKKMREQIDAADRDIVEALGKRMEVVDAIGAYKKAHGIGLFDAGRLEDVLKTRADWGAAKKLSVQFIHDLFALIHKESVAREEQA